VGQLADRISHALLARADAIAESEAGSIALRRRYVMRLRHFAGVVLSNDAEVRSLLARIEALEGPGHPFDLDYAVDIAERPETVWSGASAADPSVTQWLERVLEHQLPRSLRRITDDPNGEP